MEEHWRESPFSGSLEELRQRAKCVGKVLITTQASPGG